MHALTENIVDLVGMTRAHIADPHIVRKVMEKREGDIRPCVGANYCLDRVTMGYVAASEGLVSADGERARRPHAPIKGLAAGRRRR